MFKDNDEDQSKRKIDDSLYNKGLVPFIPVVCHYNDHTLVTRNGEVVQTFAIEGINSDSIASELHNLRRDLRTSLNKVLKGDQFAIWIHTVRKTTDICDYSEHDNLMSETIRNVWNVKNYWHDKYVNKLYLSVVSLRDNSKSNFSSYFKRLFTNKNSLKNENTILENLVKKLDVVVRGIMNNIKQYNPYRLTIKENYEGNCISEPLRFYKYLIQFIDKEFELPFEDTSSAITKDCKYTLFNAHLSVENTTHDSKKYASILSIKEYSELKQDILTQILILPIEFVITESIFFTNTNSVPKHFKYQDYVLRCSASDKLRGLKNLDVILDGIKTGNHKVCKHQITMMVINDNYDYLQSDISNISTVLSRIGLIHVLEDINLERVFWSQLPANCYYTLRAFYDVLEYACVFSGLHTIPLGGVNEKWGKAVALFRTKYGTPYFMNLYNDQGNINMIFGNHKQGKTTMMNFLFSQTRKYKANIIYITNDDSSNLFLSLQQFRLNDKLNNIINPFILMKEWENAEQILVEFLTILAGNYVTPLVEKEKDIIKKIIQNALSKKTKESMQLNKIIDKITKKTTEGKNLYNRLVHYSSKGKYANVFAGDEENMHFNNIYPISINMNELDEDKYYKEHYPREKRLLDNFYNEIDNIMHTKIGILYLLQNLFLWKKERKIIAIDNFAKIFCVKKYNDFASKFLQECAKQDVLLLATSDIKILQEFYEAKISMHWLKHIDRKYLIPPEINFTYIDKMFSLNKAEFSELKKLSSSNRTFLLKSKKESIVCELSIGGLFAIKRMLSSDREFEIYQNMLSHKGNDNFEILFNKLYEILDQETISV